MSMKESLSELLTETRLTQQMALSLEPEEPEDPDSDLDLKEQSDKVTCDLPNNNFKNLAITQNNRLKKCKTSAKRTDKNGNAQMAIYLQSTNQTEQSLLCKTGMESDEEKQVEIKLLKHDVQQLPSKDNCASGQAGPSTSMAGGAEASAGAPGSSNFKKLHRENQHLAGLLAGLMASCPEDLLTAAEKKDLQVLTQQAMTSKYKK